MTETSETRRERGELEARRTELLALIDTIGSDFGQLLEQSRRLAAQGLPQVEADSLIGQIFAGHARAADLQQRLAAFLSRLGALQTPDAIRLLREGRARLQCIAVDQIQPALADLDAILADWPEEETA